MRAWALLWITVLQFSAVYCCTEYEVLAMFNISEMVVNNTAELDLRTYYEYFNLKLTDSIDVNGYADPYKFSGDQFFYIVTINNTVFQSIVMLDPLAGNTFYPTWCMKLIREIRIEGNPELNLISLNYTSHFRNLQHIRIYNNLNLQKIELHKMKKDVTFYVVNNPIYESDTGILLKFYYKRTRHRLEIPNTGASVTTDAVPFDYIKNGSGLKVVIKEDIPLLPRLTWVSFPGECIFFDGEMSRYELLMLKYCRKFFGDLYIDQKNLITTPPNLTDPDMQRFHKKMEWLDEQMAKTNNETIKRALWNEFFPVIVSRVKDLERRPYIMRLVMDSFKNLTEITGCLKIVGVKLESLRFLEHLKIECPSGEIVIKETGCQLYNNDKIFHLWRNLRNKRPLDYYPPRYMPEDQYPTLPLSYDAPCFCNITEMIRDNSDLQYCERIEGNLFFHKNINGTIERGLRSIDGCVILVETEHLDSLDFLKETDVKCGNGFFNEMHGNPKICEPCSMIEKWPHSKDKHNVSYDPICRDNCWCKVENVTSFIQIERCMRLIGNVLMTGEIYDGWREINSYEWNNEFLGIESIRGSLTIDNTNLTTLRFLHPYLENLVERKFDKYANLRITNNEILCESEPDMVLLDKIIEFSSSDSAMWTADISNNCPCRLRGEIDDLKNINLTGCGKVYGNLIIKPDAPIKNSENISIPEVTGNVIIEDTTLTDISFLYNTKVGTYNGTKLVIRGNHDLCGDIDMIVNSISHVKPNMKNKETVEYNCGCYTLEEIENKSCTNWVGDLVLNDKTDLSQYDLFGKQIRNVLGCISIIGVTVEELPFLESLQKVNCRKVNRFAVEIRGTDVLRPIPWKLKLEGANSVKLVIVDNLLIGNKREEEASKYDGLTNSSMFIMPRDPPEITTTVVYSNRLSNINESEWAKVNKLQFDQEEYPDIFPIMAVAKKSKADPKKDSQSKKPKSEEEELGGLGTVGVVLIVLGLVALILIVCGIVVAVLIVKKRRDKKKAKKKADPAAKSLLPVASPKPKHIDGANVEASFANVHVDDRINVGVTPNVTGSHASPSPAEQETPPDQTKTKLPKATASTSNDDLKMPKTNLGKSRTGTISKDCSKENFKSAENLKEAPKNASKEIVNSADEAKTKAVTSKETTNTKAVDTKHA